MSHHTQPVSFWLFFAPAPQTSWGRHCFPATRDDKKAKTHLKTSTFQNYMWTLCYPAYYSVNNQLIRHVVPLEVGSLNVLLVSFSCKCLNFYQDVFYLLLQTKADKVPGVSFRRRWTVQQSWREWTRVRSEIKDSFVTRTPNVWRAVWTKVLVVLSVFFSCADCKPAAADVT